MRMKFYFSCHKTSFLNHENKTKIWALTDLTSLAPLYMKLFNGSQNDHAVYIGPYRERSKTESKGLKLLVILHFSVIFVLTIYYKFCQQ
jgi:hypothetical protein